MAKTSIQDKPRIAKVFRARRRSAARHFTRDRVVIYEARVLDEASRGYDEIILGSSAGGNAMSAATA